ITEVESAMRSMRGLMLALQTGGLLPFSGGRGIEKLHVNPSFVQQIIQAAATLAHKIRAQLKRQPLSRWDKNNIEPIPCRSDEIRDARLRFLEIVTDWSAKIHRALSEENPSLASVAAAFYGPAFAVGVPCLEGISMSE